MISPLVCTVVCNSIYATTIFHNKTCAQTFFNKHKTFKKERKEKQMVQSLQTFVCICNGKRGNYIKSMESAYIQIVIECRMIEEPLQKYSRSTLDVLYSLIVSLSLKNKISHKKVFVVLFEDTNATLSVSLHTLSLFIYLSPS